MKRIEIDGYEIIIGLSTETWTLNSTFNGYFIYHLDTQNIKIYYDGTLYDYDDIVKVIVNSALPAGTNIIGKMGIDQTIDGTTNKVQARNATHDNFNANANLQVNNADMSASNPGFMSLTGSILKDETSLVVTLNTDFWGTDIIATKTENSTLMIMTSASGVLSLDVDGALGSMNGGTALDANKWYAFEVLMLKDSTYNLQLSVSATAQVKWAGGM